MTSCLRCTVLRDSAENTDIFIFVQTRFFTDASTLAWSSLYGLDLEVQRDQAEYESLQILNQIVEYAQAFRIGGLGDVDERANLSGLERNVVVAQPDLQLLAPVLILLRPFCVVFLHDLAGLDNPAYLVDDSGADAHLLANQAVVSVVGVVGVSSYSASSVAENANIELWRSEVS